MSAELLVEREGAVAVLTLNRAEKMNALLGSMVDELRAAVEAAEADPEVRAAVLTGAGRGFCAGADLSAADPDARRVLREHYNPLVLAMREAELPIVCAVNGVAAGAGASLALACDLRVAAPSASFVLSFARAGLVPDAGLTWTLPRLVGPGRAYELAARAQPLSAAGALDWGLVNGLADDPRAVALEIAAELAAGPRALGLLKRALAGSTEATLAEQLEREAELQGQAAETADCAEAIAAFNERREPRFTGR